MVLKIRAKLLFFFHISKKKRTFAHYFVDFRSMTKTRKIINDPVFGFLSIPDGVLFQILQHPYMQRLNRIRQLG